jgi:hypothetical protein
MKITPKQLERVKNDWEKVAQEPLVLSDIGVVIYAFGSELACLRLFHHYRYTADVEKIAAKYSKNQKSWYFSLEMEY